MNNNSNNDNTTLLKEQLNSLQELRQKTQELIDCKAALVSKSEILDHKKDLLEEANSERQRLQKEKTLLREMLQNINQDLNSIVEVERTLAKESEDLERSINKLKTEHYEPLHDQVNEIRLKNGLTKLPHIQQELEARMAKILEERRVKWQQEENATSSFSAKRKLNSPNASNRSRRN
ncbi:uncharacterized protein BX663DRAFT_494100 [Cokeromyces recurvatus]|uniref:uncharacterized protein n=1 Tax=Cokeromyces recurvatus TaxID=90255 RepID=UPI002220D9AD|nr:uncharacterized protein BX663DRAFT_494100 [Cokeromyces recurvatus]KAI7906887.1 hypothetical protein BX663DRAFT_494100 [Cokeromyces recurvatus]